MGKGRVVRGGKGSQRGDVGTVLLPFLLRSAFSAHLRQRSRRLHAVGDPGILLGLVVPSPRIDN